MPACLCRARYPLPEPSAEQFPQHGKGADIDGCLGVELEVADQGGGQVIADRAGEGNQH